MRTKHGKCKHLNGYLAIPMILHWTGTYEDGLLEKTDSAEPDSEVSGAYTFDCTDCDTLFSYPKSRAPKWIKERVKAMWNFGIR